MAQICAATAVKLSNDAKLLRQASLIGGFMAHPVPPKLLTFDYRALRLLVGCIAVSIPIIVTIIAKTELASISASYYTDARDAFVGLLFVVAAFLWAYNGHTKHQKISSKIASIAAIGVAVFPTTCDMTVFHHVCDVNSGSFSGAAHYVFAAILFIVLSIFCFVFFQQGLKDQDGKKKRRSRIYFICGVVMVVAMLLLVSTNVFDYAAKFGWTSVVFWAEAAALIAFGVAWIVAGKAIPWLVNKDEKLNIL
jgi:protein-S-isoprenylcysteine O-methyltransferase Ste14